MPCRRLKCVKTAQKLYLKPTNNYPKPSNTYFKASNIYFKPTNKVWVVPWHSLLGDKTHFPPRLGKFYLSPSVQQHTEKPRNTPNLCHDFTNLSFIFAGKIRGLKTQIKKIMELTREKLLYFWRNRKNIFSANKESKDIIQRYNSLKPIFDELLSMKVEWKGDKVYVNEAIVHLEGDEDLTPSKCYFACKEDDLTRQGAYNGVIAMAKAMPEYVEIIHKVGSLLGGFDFEKPQMKESYRIISNSVTSPDDRGALISHGIVRHPSSNFADNNYFFNVASVVREISKDCFDPNRSMLVLRYPASAYYADDAEAESSQRNALNHRFPYKFFYMWTHTEKVLHLVGLQTYQMLARQNNDEMRYKQDKDINQPFSKFIGGWEEYSKTICDMIPVEERGEDLIDELSKLLSVVSAVDIDMKNVKDLLETGNKAIVLWGPPGTGKTYTAKELVCQELEIEEADKLVEYGFDAKKPIPPKGCWSIVQFHPNYTYEDFIGGISPELKGGNLSYTLKEGIFKQLCDVAAKEENRDKKFVIIIDEINRADLSAVFGELMYALEYRDEQVSIPNFEKKFVIPNNVYLIGTMNSVDKSLATFDIALRRRFGFFKMMPNLDVLLKVLSKDDMEEDTIFLYKKQCEKLNEEIANKNNSLQLGEDYQIGQAYFLKIRDFVKSNDEGVKEITSFDLEKLWIYHLLPLLEEYLGNRVDSPEIKSNLDKMKVQFTTLHKE